MQEEIRLENYFNLVHRLASPYARILRCKEVRDCDAFSEGLFLLVKAKSGFNAEFGVKFITYAYPIIERGLWVWWRKNKPLLTTEAIELGFPEKPKEIPIFDQEEIELLKTFSDLFLFDPSLKFIFERRLKGLKFEEISKNLGCSKQNVEQRFKRSVIPTIKNHLEKINGIKTNYPT